MNCDDVFEVLTAAAEGDGACAKQVDSHLARCPACRELAAALRPAVALLRTSAVCGDHHEAPASPAAAPWLAEAGVAPAPLDGSWIARSNSNRRWLNAAWPLAAAVLIGVAVGGAAQRWLGGGWPAGGAPTLSEQPDGSWELSFATDQFDGRIRLASACVGDEPISSRDGRIAFSDLACCTNCHHARAAMPTLAVAEVAASCRLCHSP